MLVNTRYMGDHFSLYFCLKFFKCWKYIHVILLQFIKTKIWRDRQVWPLTTFTFLQNGWDDLTQDRVSLPMVTVPYLFPQQFLKPHITPSKRTLWQWKPIFHLPTPHTYIFPFKKFLDFWILKPSPVTESPDPSCQSWLSPNVHMYTQPCTCSSFQGNMEPEKRSTCLTFTTSMPLIPSP